MTPYNITEKIKYYPNTIKDTIEPRKSFLKSKFVLYFRSILRMTTPTTKPDEEPIIPQEVGEAKSSSGGKAPWSGLNSIITERELKNAKNLRLVAKMLLGEITRLGREIEELRSFRDGFYKKSELLAVLTERITGLETSMTVRALLFSLGGIMGGLIFLPDLSKYQLPIIVLCFLSFALAIWNPRWLGKK